ncbi:hypothetical protein ACH4TV_36465 [Streptomyces sp. NPDC020898]|uniref:hypothetical protein n=1 Tax=Streptomyces sp. NPDC020898 TaxID=3365101 RepID=UPI00379DDD2D
MNGSRQRAPFSTEQRRALMSPLEFTVLTPNPMSTPYENTAFAVPASPVPAEAVPRPYAGNLPALTQKGLPQ